VKLWTEKGGQIHGGILSSPENDDDEIGVGKGKDPANVITEQTIGNMSESWNYQVD